MSTVLILLATYNGEKYIKEMIDSIIAQDYSDWSLILSDDCSSDSTAEILEAYASEYAEKITHYKSGKRFGNAQDHFMHLLENFHTAPYIMFCDQDDVWHTDKISKTLEKMKKTEQNAEIPAMVHTDLRVVDKDLNVIDPSFMHFSKLDGNRMTINALLMQNVVTGCTMMINRALAEISIANIPENGILMHDWWLALIASAYSQVGFLNEATIDYRQHGSNVVGAKNTRSVKYLLQKASVKAVRTAIFNCSYQAEALINAFGTEISDSAKKTVAAFASIKDSGYLKRRLIFIRFKFYKIGIGRIIAQFLLG